MSKPIALLASCFGLFVAAFSALAERPGQAQRQPAFTLPQEQSSYEPQPTNQDQALRSAVKLAQFDLQWQGRAPFGEERTAGYLGVSRDQNLNAWFGQDSVTVTPIMADAKTSSAWAVGLSLKAYGYGGRLEDRPPVIARKAKGAHIDYERGHSAIPEIVEWYDNRAEGIEQGFTLASRPERGGDAPESAPLRLVLSLTGDLQARAREGGSGVELRDVNGIPVLTYGSLIARDSTGKQLAARMEANANGLEIALVIEDADAKYPIAIDPILAPESKLTAADGGAGDNFGYAVAISGNTAVVGGFHDSNLTSTRGAVYVFVRNADNTWSQQAKLQVGDDTATPQFGSAVAISGNTVVVGDADYGDYNYGFPQYSSFPRGAAYVFLRTGKQWSASKRITASDAVNGDNFGASVAVSGDTIVVGADMKDPTASFPTYNNPGQAYVFLQNGSEWVEQAKLGPTGATGPADYRFGHSVAISGEVAVIGAPYDDVGQNVDQGAAYIFVRNALEWSTPQRLTAADGRAVAHFGYSVAISGTTAIIGDSYFGTANGNDASEDLLIEGAYLFVLDGTSYRQQQKLSLADVNGAVFDSFGRSVAISGNTAVVGAYAHDIDSNANQGSAYTFTRNGSSWSLHDTLQASDGAAHDAFGWAVAVSGQDVVVGAPGHDNGATANQGEAYIYSPLDSDGDGIPDEWETNGITIDSSGAITIGKGPAPGVFIDLPAMGADPMHKDIFVHAEWMNPDPSRPGSRFKPFPRAMKAVMDAFAIAPVENPDHTNGIHLHLDAGPDSIMDPVSGRIWDNLSRTGADDLPFKGVTGTFRSGNVYEWSEVDEIKKMHFLPSQRSAIFHYVLFCNTYGDANNSSGGIARDIPASDFIVTLGCPGCEPPGGSVLAQAVTFMHELGHNLGLHHGGNEDVNNKPNYISIMNYSFGLTGLLTPNWPSRTLDYSRDTLATLDKSNLNENIGIGDPAGHLTTWSRITAPTSPSGTNPCTDEPSFFYRRFYPSEALDWNCNGARDSAPASADVDGGGTCVRPGDDGVLHSIPAGDDEIRRDVEFGNYVDKITKGANGQCESTATGTDIQLHRVGYIPPDELTGFKDWPALVFRGGGIGSAAIGLSGPTLTPNNEAPRSQLLAFAPPALLDEEALAPVDIVTPVFANGSAPFSVAFDGSKSTAVNGTIVEWLWDFGDGATASGANVTHVYSNPGIYFAKLKVTDSSGHGNLIPSYTRVTVLGQGAQAGLGNVSTRLRVEPGDNALIGGFIVTGTQPKKVLIRAIGPSTGIPGALADPKLDLYSGQTLLESNDNWVDSPNKQAIIDTTIPPPSNLESAIVRTLPANNSAYTAIVNGADGGTGVGLVEVYDVDQSVDSKLANISTRGLVQTKDDVMIGGFIVLNGNQKVIVRAIGPSLPVAGALADPLLELHDANGNVTINDNWRTGGQEAEIIATTIPPSNDAESAIVQTLAPGNYTAIVRGVNDTTGVALVEVFALN